MTQRNRWTVNSLALVCGVLAFALALGRFREIGRAEARATFALAQSTPALDAGSGETVSIPPPPAGSLGDELLVVDAGAPTDDGSRTVPRETVASGSNRSPDVAAPAREVDVSLALTLWRSGAFTSAGIVIVYLLLTLWRKVDKKRAFYISGALGGADILINCVANGATPTAAMMMAAVSTVLAILARGPTKESEAKDAA